VALPFRHAYDACGNLRPNLHKPRTFGYNVSGTYCRDKIAEDA
jgi:hypothetical protein